MGACSAAIAAGTAYDATATLISEKPQGIIAAVNNFATKPNPETLFDAASVPLSDALYGYSGATVAKQITKSVQVDRVVRQNFLGLMSQTLSLIANRSTALTLSMRFSLTTNIKVSEK